VVWCPVIEAAVCRQGCWVGWEWGRRGKGAGAVLEKDSQAKDRGQVDFVMNLNAVRMRSSSILINPNGRVVQRIACW
jgi:hypothetical protein